MTDNALHTALRHNTWANLALIDFCSGSTAERLGWTHPGTYGSIHATLQHIVGAEQGYLFALTGGELPPAGPLPAEGLVPLSDLRGRAVASVERMERILGGHFDPSAHLMLRRGGTATGGVLISQYLHHGSDHRAHIGTILGAHGVEAPELDVWAYGSSIGEVSRPPAG